MKAKLCSRDTTVELIESGKNLLIAAENALLSSLPRGSWIGGSIPYFMDEQKGGCCDTGMFQVTELPANGKVVSITSYDKDSISNVYSEGPENGFSIIILPAASTILVKFSLDAPTFEDFAMNPLVGWVAGVHLDKLEHEKPAVYDGSSGAHFENRAVVMRVELPEKLSAEVGIVNIFEQGDGDELLFPKDTLEVDTVIVNGTEKVFTDYIHEKRIDIKLPLVADMSGAMINTSFQSVDDASGIVKLYAPVFEGVPYKIAKPVENYVEAFASHMPEDAIENLTFSCNCILNYLNAELDGKKTAEFTGPITFGEIAYQLLNQTLVYVTIN